MGNKMIWLIIIAATAIFIFGPYFEEASKSPERKKYDQYEEKLCSYIEELKSAPPDKTASIKSKIDDLIRQYKVWKKHVGWAADRNSIDNMHKKKHRDVDDMIRDYERVNTTNEKTIYMGGD